MPAKNFAAVRDRAARMIRDRLSEHPSMYAACKAVAPKLDVGPESLPRWVSHFQVDAGQGIDRAPMSSRRCGKNAGSQLNARFNAENYHVLMISTLHM
ncbi:hypothetical protein QMQ05_15510 [Glutamicibacter ectropisis]|uniref:Transposase n=1 Tax=Glutamicibacter ectropisis TaxID=3046593 RepID=A0AAU6WDF3_9MICC